MRLNNTPHFFQYYYQKIRSLSIAVAATGVLSLNAFSQTMPVAPAGTGSESDPYRICTFAELKWICTNNTSWDKEIVLMNDIDASETKSGTISECKRIGDSEKIFTGRFHGHNHTIKNFKMNQPDQAESGLFGHVAHPCVIDSLCIDSTYVVGANKTGALIGVNEGANINFCSATNVYVDGQGQYTGGLIGMYTHGGSADHWGTATGCYTTGQVYGKSGDCGGLVGWLNSYLGDCYSTAAVAVSSGPHSTGGLVGWIDDCYIARSYATGIVRVTNVSYVGGLVGGKNSAKQATIDNGSVGCFWDTQTSGQNASACGSGKTTAEMKTQATYNSNPGVTYANFDFSNIWAFSSATNSGYPFLRISGIIVLTTVSVKGVTDSTKRMNKIVCTGNLISLSMDHPLSYGFVYGTSPNPTIASSVDNKGKATNAGVFTSTISGLSGSDTTVYYVRAFATNNAGTFYGEQRAFIPGVASYHWQMSSGLQPVSSLGKSGNTPFLGKKAEGTMPLVADSTPLWLDKSTDGKRYVADLKSAGDISYGYTWGTELTDQNHTFYVTAKNTVPDLSVACQRSAGKYSRVRFRYSNDTVYSSHFDKEDWKGTYAGLASALTSDSWVPYFVHIRQVSKDSLSVTFGAANQEIATVMVGDTDGGTWNAGSAYCWVTSDSANARVSDVHVFSTPDTMCVTNIWRAFFSPEYLDNGPLHRIPLVIHNIIYDPPGSDSYESCTFDSSTSTKYQFDFTTNADLSLEVGVKGSVDFGVAFIVKAGASVDVQETVKGEYHYQYDHSHGTEFTFNNSTATTSMIDNVASEYMGPAHGDVVVYQSFAFRTSMMRRPYMSKFRTASDAKDFVYASAGGIPVPDSCGAVYYKPIQTLVSELRNDSAGLRILQNEYPYDLTTGKVVASALDSTVDPVTKLKKGPRLVKYEDTQVVGGNITYHNSINRGTTYFSDRKDTWGYALTYTSSLWILAGFELSVSSSSSWACGYNATSTTAKTLDYELKDNTSWDILKITPYTDTRFNTICFLVDSANSYTSFPVEPNTRPSVSWEYSAVPACTAYVGQAATVVVNVTNTSPKAIVTGLPDFFKFSISAVNFPGTFSVYPEDARIAVGQTVPFTFTFTGADVGSFLQEIRVDCWQPLTNGYSQFNSIKVPMVIKPADVGLVAVIPVDTVIVSKGDALSNAFKVKLVNTGKFEASVISGEVSVSTGAAATYSTITNPVGAADTTLLTVTLSGDGKQSTYSVTFWTQIQGVPETKSLHTLVLAVRDPIAVSVQCQRKIRELGIKNIGGGKLSIQVPDNDHARLRVFTIDGKTVYSSAFNPGQTILNLVPEKFSNGYYLLMLQGKKNTVRQKFLVSKN